MSVQRAGANTIKSSIEIESGIHGSRWEKLHGGYFSDPSVAAPYIEIILKAVELSKPGIVVDLGGGTGFLLRELIKHYHGPKIPFVNLDLSDKQLRVTRDDRILSIRRSLAEFSRADIGKERARFLFIMRSALHYFGRSGLNSILRHIRSQMREGEFFVHQTACFAKARDARCLNELYRQMGTIKWYPTEKYLLSRLDKEGWDTVSNGQAPILTLDSYDLGIRYKVSKALLMEIRDDLARAFGEKEGVFELTPKGFRAFLHYRIFRCVAR